MITKIDDFIKRVESTAEEDFFTPRTFYHLSSSMFHEMCELLKEHESVETPLDAFGHPYCPKCKVLVYQTWHYCPHCGQAVKCER